MSEMMYQDVFIPTTPAILSIVKTVYLAGPITGYSYGTVTDWRKSIEQELALSNIKAVSPMRGKKYLKKEKHISDSYESIPMSCSKGVVTRDRYDSMHCDLLLVNLLGASKVSIGTMIEIGWADSCRIPIILVMESSGNPHEHAMVREIAGFCVETLMEAQDIIKAIVGNSL